MRTLFVCTVGCSSGSSPACLHSAAGGLRNLAGGMPLSPPPKHTKQVCHLVARVLPLGQGGDAQSRLARWALLNGSFLLHVTHFPGLNA